MRLTADRLDVVEDETIRGVAIVHPSMVSVLAAGGLKHLVHEIEDVGFRDVGVFVEPPASWAADEVPTPSDLEWLLWFEATATRSASLQRDLTSDLRITDAWDASEVAHEYRGVLHPYAVSCAATMTLGGGLRAFGVAYPIEVQ